MSDNHSSKAPGGHTRNEILSQPACWRSCLAELPRILAEEKIVESFAGAREWLFVGCGSSYYIALAAAASWSAITGQRARAVPASEILLFPELALAGASGTAAVVISRSGQTSEALLAAEVLERDKDIRTLGVTCTPRTRLHEIATCTLTLLPAQEESTVMTRSFTSMLLGLQFLAASVSNTQQFLAAVKEMPVAADSTLQRIEPQIRALATAHAFEDYIALGQGPFYGLACECGLKLSEMSVSYGQSFHTMEFRHGPKAVVSPSTLLLFLISESAYDAEVEVLEEMKSLGGTTLTVVNRATERVRACSDLLVEFDFVVPELARLAPYVFAGQLLGLYTGLRKGVDPDKPRNLTRVVMLPDKPEKKHAAL